MTWHRLREPVLLHIQLTFFRGTDQFFWPARSPYHAHEKRLRASIKPSRLPPQPLANINSFPR